MYTFSLIKYQMRQLSVSLGQNLTVEILLLDVRVHTDEESGDYYYYKWNALNLEQN